jgi:hypothetical protein
MRVARLVSFFVRAAINRQYLYVKKGGLVVSIIRVADFYYGAAFSVLFNNSNKKISAALIESDKERQLYDLMTDNTKCRLFIKYRSDKQGTKTEGYSSWQFNLTERDKIEILAILNEEHNLVLALVCGVAGPSESELALIDKKQVKELIDMGKDSITISRKKGEHAYRISIGGGRENSTGDTKGRFFCVLIHVKAGYYSEYMLQLL